MSTAARGMTDTAATLVQQQQVSRDRHIHALAAQRISQRAIGQEVGLSAATVGRDDARRVAVQLLLAAETIERRERMDDAAAFHDDDDDNQEPTA